MTGTKNGDRSFYGERCGVANRSEMHRANLLRPDVLSEVVLLGFGTLILASLALFLAMAFARA